MILTEETGSGRYQIKAYTPSALTINQTSYHNSLILTENELILDWRPQTMGMLTLEDLSPILALSPAIILLGTGQSFIMPAASFLNAARALQIGIEYMDTSAACRTFMALTSEGRNVAAALML